MALKSMGFAVLASLCLSHSAEAQQTFDWKKYSGRTVNVALAKQPWSDFITPQIPDRYYAPSRRSGVRLFHDRAWSRAAHASEKFGSA